MCVHATICTQAMTHVTVLAAADRCLRLAKPWSRAPAPAAAGTAAAWTLEAASRYRCTHLKLESWHARSGA